MNGLSFSVTVVPHDQVAHIQVDVPFFLAVMCALIYFFSSCGCISTRCVLEHNRQSFFSFLTA